MIKALLLDLSGVLYEGAQLLPGAVDAVAAVQQRGLPLRLVTNTSRLSRTAILAQLRDFGFKVDDAQLFTAVDAARQWLAANGRRPYLLVHGAIHSEFADFDHSDPDAVVVADAAEGFTYAAVNRAFQLCIAGAPLVAVGYNRYFKSRGALWLDSGAFVRALEFAAGVEAVIVGKPGAEFFHQVLASTGVAPCDALMVGDDVLGDVEGALKAGLAACLVRTGKYRPGDEHTITGDFALVDSIVEAVQRVLDEAPR